MRRHRLAWAPLLAAALLFPACDGSSGNGGNGGDEDPGFCERSSQCPAGEVCDRGSSTCVAGECAEDVSCPAGQTCGTDHHCTAPCTTTSDCPTGQRCFLPDGKCYGGEPCTTTEDCPAPERSKDRVFCNEIQFVCETAFAACTQATGWEDCAEGEYCHESGWCAPQPVFCTSDTCPPGTHCNLVSGECDPDPTCDEGDCPDPVDGTCRKCVCINDGQCEPDEWCDQMNTGMCRGQCSGTTGCLTGEKCEAGRCVADQGCTEGEECTAGACDCAAGLICWARPGDDSGNEYCLKECDPVAAVSSCPSGKRCAPLRDATGYEVHRGGCVDENDGGQAGETCDAASSPCEVDNLCKDEICRALCSPAAPDCGAGEICIDHEGIGVCVPEPTCRSDVECDPPAQICDLDVFPGSCEDGCGTTGCTGGLVCNTQNGRCEANRSCQTDVDCGAPSYICSSGKCTSGCMFVGCHLPLTCNHTTGRCDHGCTVDQDCYPPDHICEGGQCTEGCVSTGCTLPEVCDTITGRCGVDTCQADDDCNPPNTICDEVTLKCKPGCISVGCGADEACNVDTGRCDKLCGQDADCSPPDTICVAGRCEDGCVVKPDPKCPGGTECDPTTGRCKATFCSSDSHCDPPHYICDFGTSLCVQGCVYTGCGPGKNCNQTTGRCQ